MLQNFEYIIVSIKKVMFRLWVVIRYKNKKARKYHLKKITTKTEKKYLSRYLNVLENNILKKTKSNTKIIWFCWLQGKENMPPIVETCLKSIQKFHNDYQIILITNDNMHNYVKLPEYIIRKKKLGYITNTHFSDILRVSLLALHGGIWIDATVYLSAPLPTQIIHSDFFAYHTDSYVNNNSWLLKSEPQNPLMINMQNLLYAYWKNENKLINYFLYHLFFDLMIENNENCKNIWQNIPLIYDDCYELEKNFFNQYSKNKWLEINKITTIHKLSWKYKKEPQKGDFLSHLLSNTLGD